MAVRQGPDEPLRLFPEPKATFDIKLYAQLVGNQLLLGAPVVFALGGLQTLLEHGHFDSAWTWLAGGLGALPMLALGRAVERSRSEAVVDLNSATTLLAFKLFGFRSQPIFAGAACAALAILIACAEETLFRGLALPALASTLELIPGVSPVIATTCSIACTSAVFALLHLNPRYLRPSAEAAVTLALQSAAGFWFALLAVGTSPSAASMDHLGVAIIAHALYDWNTVYSTHLAVTDRYAFAAEAVARDAKSSAAFARWSRERSPEWAQDVAYCFHYLDLDRSDSIDLDEVRVALRTFGLRLSREDIAEWWASATGSADPDSAAALCFDDFARVVSQIQDPREPHSAAKPKAAPLTALRDSVRSPLKKKGLLGVRPPE